MDSRQGRGARGRQVQELTSGLGHQGEADSGTHVRAGAPGGGKFRDSRQGRGTSRRQVQGLTSGSGHQREASSGTHVSVEAPEGSKFRGGSVSTLDENIDDTSYRHSPM